MPRIAVRLVVGVPAREVGVGRLERQAEVLDFNVAIAEKAIEAIPMNPPGRSAFFHDK